MTGTRRVDPAAAGGALEAFATEVGGVEAGPVCVRGGATQWSIGGQPWPDVREVRAPAGVITYQPAEMTVRAGAGTTLAELHAALAEHRQTTVLAGAPDATVGGLLAVGRNGIDSPRHGAVRDALLEARYVAADGRLITAGGPTVKNVTGFDLCRMLVGSLGTLGLLGEVTLRTRPLPQADIWVAGTVDPFTLVDRLYRPAAVLWDGTTTWVHLEGYTEDIAAQTAICRSSGCVEVAGPPPLPPERVVGLPAALRGMTLAGTAVVAEVLTGVLHTDPAMRTVGERSATDRLPAHHAGNPAWRAAAEALQQRLRDEFDPTRRLNPGRDPLTAT